MFLHLTAFRKMSLHGILWKILWNRPNIKKIKNARKIWPEFCDKLSLFTAFLLTRMLFEFFCMVWETVLSTRDVENTDGAVVKCVLVVCLVQQIHLHFSVSLEFSPFELLLVVYHSLFYFVFIYTNLYSSTIVEN